jgi:hypothetical protein
MEHREVADVLQGKSSEQRDLLLQIKADARNWGSHVAWPWNGLVLSATTRGGSTQSDQNVKPRCKRGTILVRSLRYLRWRAQAET